MKLIMRRFSNFCQQLFPFLRTRRLVRKKKDMSDWIMLDEDDFKNIF